MGNKWARGSAARERSNLGAIACRGKEGSMEGWDGRCVQAFIVHATQPVGCARALGRGRGRGAYRGECARRAAIRPPKMARAMGHGRACPVPAANGQGAERVLSIRGTDRRSASMRMHALAL